MSTKTAADVTTGRLIEGLTQPQAYPHPVEAGIEVHETHISIIFLAGDFAYKIKVHQTLSWICLGTRILEAWLPCPKFVAMEDSRKSPAGIPPATDEHLCRTVDRAIASKVASPRRASVRFTRQVNCTAQDRPSVTLDTGAIPQKIQQHFLPIHDKPGWTKIKKPIKTDILDYSTLELRRHYCDEEVRLDSRYAYRI